jgi:hypothetical protein
MVLKRDSGLVGVCVGVPIAPYYARASHYCLGVIYFTDRRLLALYTKTMKKRLVEEKRSRELLLEEHRAMFDKH